MTESREQVLVSILARLLLVATLLLQTLALHRTIEVMRTQARTIDALRQGCEAPSPASWRGEP